MPYPLRVAGAFIGSVCLLAGILGNLLVLLSIWRYRPLRRTVNLFVASLAACDLIQTLVVRTLHIQTYVSGQWTLGRRTCVYALVVSNLVILEDTVTHEYSATWGDHINTVAETLDSLLTKSLNTSYDNPRRHCKIFRPITGYLALW